MGTRPKGGSVKLHWGSVVRFLLLACGSAGLATAQFPDLLITKTHIGTFTRGQSGYTYTITVSNVGDADLFVGSETSSPVDVTETVPVGLTAAGISGTGWACTQPAGPCTRDENLTPGTAYPPITLTVSV